MDTRADTNRGEFSLQLVAWRGIPALGMGSPQCQEPSPSLPDAAISETSLARPPARAEVIKIASCTNKS